MISIGLACTCPSVMLVNEWMRKRTRCYRIACMSILGNGFWILFISGSSESLSFPWNALLFSPLKLSLIFLRRLFTRFSLFPLPLHLILSSLSFLHNIHCWAEFSFFSRQSEPSAFLEKREASPDAPSLLISWDWIFSLSHTIVCSQQRMAEQSQPTLI